MPRRSPPRSAGNDLGQPGQIHISFRSRCDLQHLEMRRHLAGVVDALGRFLEIRLLGAVDVDKCLGVAVDQREPGALDLDHDLVTGAEGVGDVLQREIDRRRPGWETNGSGFDRLLRNLPRITSPRTSCWKPPNLTPDCVGVVVGIDVDQLDDPVGIGPGRRNEEPGLDRAGDRDILGELITLVDQDIGPAGGDCADPGSCSRRSCRSRSERYTRPDGPGRFDTRRRQARSGHWVPRMPVRLVAAGRDDFRLALRGGQASNVRHWLVPVSKTQASGKLADPLLFK